MNIKNIIASTAVLGCLTALPVQAQRVSVSTEVVEDSIKQLDIMVGDNTGDLQLSKPVSRAEFATMLVAASPYKNVTTHFGYTLFPDVPSTHWATGYIKVVVEQGYMLGQLDGSFAPDRGVLLEEAVTAVLALLGYTNNTLSGTYPQAQLAKYYELDLDESMTAVSGTALTREDCMYLFYNVLNTETLNGTPYAAQLGHAVTLDGSLDTLALTSANTQGPFLVGTYTLPEAVHQVDTLYKNDKQASSADFSDYDICYYNEKLDTVWIYDEKVTGRLTAVDSLYSPSQVTVAGTTYNLETTNAKYKFAVGGSFEEGDMVTLLLGQYGMVADVVSASATDSSMLGIVTDSGTRDSVESTGSHFTYYATIVTTNGDLVTLDTNASYPAGRLLEITYTAGEEKVVSVTDKNLTGTVNSAASKLGNYTLASDIEIIEFHDGEFATIYPSRLAGASLSDEDVRYYTTNSKGEIDRLVLENVTGDAAKFAFVSNVNEIPVSATDSHLLLTYRYQGITFSHYTENSTLDVSVGGAYIEMTDYNLTKIENLEKISLTSLTALHGSVGGKTYPLSEQVHVYEKFKSGYELSTVSNVSDPEKYTLTAYYDDDIFSAGGYIRIIVADPIG